MSCLIPSIFADVLTFFLTNKFRLHYHVNMTAVQVGVGFLNLTTEIFMLGDKKGAFIDSGTTLAYLLELIYQPLLEQVINCLALLR